MIAELGQVALLSALLVTIVLGLFPLIGAARQDRALMALATPGAVLQAMLVFIAYFLWSTSIFFMLGFSLGNLNALAMEPMGHIAGMAASIAGSVSTVISVLIAVPVGLAFNGTPLPLAIGSVLCCAAGCLVMRAVARLERVAVSH